MTGNNPAVTDLECLNCWNAIRAVGAARHYIARVQGQPINTVSYFLCESVGSFIVVLCWLQCRECLLMKPMILAGLKMCILTLGEREHACLLYTLHLVTLLVRV